jgi:tetratricopeptide (TPR) repeat protein
VGFRMSKSIKLAPGVRMTVSKRGVGYSAGGKGYRVTKRAGGRLSQTVSLPGTGLSYEQSLSSTSRAPATGRAASSSRSATPTQPALPAPPKPGLFAPRAEKDLFQVLTKQDWDRLPSLAAAHPDWRPLIAALDGFFCFQGNNHDRARQALEFAFESGIEQATHPFVQRYVTRAAVTLGIADGVTAELPLDRQAIGLALAELLQEAGHISGAIDIVEQLEPSTPAAVSLAELYLQAGKAPEVIALTNGITNEDDATALLCVFRGVALRETGAHGASLEALKEALRSRKRAAEIRHRALIERSATYLAAGKRAMARKDLERVQAEDANYPGLTDALTSLGT